MRFSPSTFAAAVALMAAAPVAALAADPSVPTAHVVYGDLNLASASGMATFHNRLTHAVNEVCGTASELRDLTGLHQVKACRADAMEQAHEQLHGVVTVAQSTAALTLTAASRAPAP